jgi:hypothetical protein
MIFAEVIIYIYGYLYNRKFVPSGILAPFRFILRRLANYWAQREYQKEQKKKYKEETIKEKEIVLSLTSFPARIANVWIVIESLLRQTLKPDHIILWLSKDQFPNEEGDIPSVLRKRESSVFEIRFVEGDLRSHKKYYYAFSEYANAFVILVDDDIIYPSNMIEALVRKHKENPNAVICRYGFNMTYDEGGIIKPYNEWIETFGYFQRPFFFGSGGGTLFEPCKLYKDTLNKNLFTQLTPLADDVWLNAMTRLSRLDIIAESNVLLMPIINKNDIRLTEENVYDNKNDIQIQKVRDYYINKNGIDPFSIQL